MSPAVLSREAVRQLDRRAVEEYGLSSIVLMENAGRGVTDVLCALGIGGAVAICCGAGNNGGDGFVIARHLDLRGYPIRVLLFADPQKLAGDAATNYLVLIKSGLPICRPTPDELLLHLTGCAWVVDALLGTGARGEPRPPLDEIIQRINSQPTPVLAVDLPSGLDCDTGQPALHTIRAAHTCTFVALKPGLVAPGAQKYTGEVHVLDIGAPRKLIEEMLQSATSS